MFASPPTLLLKMSSFSETSDHEILKHDASMHNPSATSERGYLLALRDAITLMTDPDEMR